LHNTHYQAYNAIGTVGMVGTLLFFYDSSFNACKLPQIP